MAHEVPYAVHTCWTEQPVDYNHDETLYILLLLGHFVGTNLIEPMGTKFSSFNHIPVR